MSDTDRLREIAAFMREFGFGRGDTGDAPHVEAAADEIDRLRAALREMLDYAGGRPLRRPSGAVLCDARNLLAEPPATTPLAPAPDGR